MLHVTTPTPERFSALAPEPAADWSVGHRAVVPEARRANPRIRGTIEKAGFTVRSARTDFVLWLGG